MDEGGEIKKICRVLNKLSVCRKGERVRGNLNVARSNLTRGRTSLGSYDFRKVDSHLWLQRFLLTVCHTRATPLAPRWFVRYLCDNVHNNDVYYACRSPTREYQRVLVTIYNSRARRARERRKTRRRFTGEHVFSFAYTILLRWEIQIVKSVQPHLCIHKQKTVGTYIFLLLSRSVTGVTEFWNYMNFTIQWTIYYQHENCFLYCTNWGDKWIFRRFA